MRAWALAIVLLTASSQPAAAGTADSLVIEAILLHFAKRTDATFPNHDGLLLVEPNSQVWTTQTLATFGLLNRTSACLPEADLAEQIAIRNSSAFVVASVVSPTTGWRFLGRDEFPDSEPAPRLETSDGVSIKTVAAVSLPVFSPNKRHAFALLSYRWAVHSAIAEYALVKGDAGWNVNCSDLHIYP
jgi:hypothetical protein